MIASAAYELARSAYLDHFEFVEIPLRLRDPNLVLDLEFEFADLRDGIRERRSDRRGEGHRSARCGRASTTSSARSTEEGFAAPALAFGFSFSILFREGLEAVLLIAMLLGSLEAARAANYRRPLAWGAAGAVVATAVTFALASDVIEIAPVNREVLEAVRGPARGGGAVLGHLLARLSPRTAALDGVHARAGVRRGRRRRRCSRSPGSASPPSTARASRPCSSTRRWLCSPRG